MRERKSKLYAGWKSRLNHWFAVNAPTEDGQRRGRLLAQFLSVFITLAFAITLNNLWNWIFASSVVDRGYLPIDVSSLAILASIWVLNRQGRTKFAAHITLLMGVIGGSIIYRINYNNLALLYHVFPILLSSFVLKPSWSFIYAAFSVLGYSLAHFAGNPSHPYSIEVVLIYFTLSVISFLSAALLEEAVDNARRSETRYRNFVERIPAIIYTAATDRAKTRLYVSPQVEKILGFTQAEYLADSKLWQKLLHPDDLQRVLSESEYFYASSEPFISEYRTFTRDGRILWFHDEAVIVHDDAGKPQLIQGVTMDISERKQAEDKVNSHLARLASLRAIDTAIMSTRDLRMIFFIVLSQTIARLQIDAASILLFNPSTQTLEFGAAQGFRAQGIEKKQVRLGEGIAGRAAEEGIILHQHHLTKEYFLSNAPLLAEEGFTCFYAAPLISKGKIKGVLEVFEREHRHHDRDWVDFLNSLAGQVAIAIDNTSLFNDLQRSNTDLRLAYETTLEGWSAALDLRDRETEGHTQRVTKLTEKIAKSIGMAGEYLLNIRRGALLHDIGKMGVPDQILLKQGPLTKQEWAVMRKHPQFAYDLLYPIPYLRNALDIPFCHHEKWDGSGYPRGLQGTEIPLAARIFAVVDIYDALTSDRPYRKGWTKQQTLDHIREQAGTHFDPRIVERFLQMMQTHDTENN